MVLKSQYILAIRYSNQNIVISNGYKINIHVIKLTDAFQPQDKVGHRQMNRNSSQGNLLPHLQLRHSARNKL